MNKNKVSKDKGVQNTSIDKSAVYSKSLDKHVRASELATEALGAAKKLVPSEEDLPPEEIPTAAASSLKDIENMASASAAAHSSKAVSAPKPAEEKDELFL